MVRLGWVTACKEGWATPSMIAGGISISLDIDKTFDSLPREQLVLAMKAAKLSSEEIALALYIHQEARLHVEISGQKADIPLQQGIRQGCGLSPFLWSLATARLYNVCVEKAATCREPTGEVTLYADDVWASWWIRTQDQFKASLRAMGILFQVLQEAGLTGFRASGLEGAEPQPCTTLFWQALIEPYIGTFEARLEPKPGPQAF